MFQRNNSQMRRQAAKKIWAHNRNTIDFTNSWNKFHQLQQFLAFSFLYPINQSAKHSHACSNQWLMTHTYSD